MTVDVEGLHRQFKRDLGWSVAAVQKVSRYLRLRGWEVRVPTTTVAPTIYDRHEHSDSGDLFISKDGIELIIEVKRLGKPDHPVNWTCRGDWPFGSRFIVDGANVYDNKKHKPDWYFVVSSNLSYAAIFSVRETKERWWKEYIKNRYQAEYGVEKVPYYFMSANLVREWRCLDDVGVEAREESA